MAKHAARKDQSFDSRFCDFLFRKLKSCRFSVFSLATHLGVTEGAIFNRRTIDYIWTLQDMVEIAKFFEMHPAALVTEFMKDGA